MYNTLIIGWGGLRIYNYLGVLKYLENYKLLNNIKNYYGCWAGWLLNWLLYIGYWIDEIIKISIN